MKKIFLSMLCAGAVMAANAQEKSVLLFGDLGGNTNQQETSSTSGKATVTNFHITPGVGYQFDKHWTLGLEATMMYYSNKHNPSVAADGSTMQFGGGVFGRYTWSISNLIFVYTQLDVIDAAGKSYDANGNSLPGTTNTLSAMITPAIGINIKNGYAINFSFGNLGFSQTTATGGFTNSSFDYNFGRGMSFGMTKNFLHKMKKKAKKDTNAEGADNE